MWKGRRSCTPDPVHPPTCCSGKRRKGLHRLRDGNQTQVWRGGQKSGNPIVNQAFSAKCWDCTPSWARVPGRTVLCEKRRQNPWSPRYGCPDDEHCAEHLESGRSGLHSQITHPVCAGEQQLPLPGETDEENFKNL